MQLINPQCFQKSFANIFVGRSKFMQVDYKIMRSIVSLVKHSEIAFI